MKSIMIIGAGFLQAFVIDKAKELGFYTIAVDGNPEAPGFTLADEYKVINIVDQEACLAYAMEKKINGVLTAATDYGVLTACYIANEMKLPGLDYETALLIKNKYRIRKRLFEKKADDAEQAYEVTCYEDIKALEGKLHFPVMVKPCDGSGSRGASKVEQASEFEMACRNAMMNSISHRAEVESFIDGVEYGAESFVYDGKVTVLAVMRKWMTNPPNYAELGHSIPSCLVPEMENKVKATVSKAIHALGINFGSVNMDLLITAEGGVHIIDVGARMGGNLIGSNIIPLGTGIDYMAAMINGAVGKAVNLKPGMAAKPVVTRLLALSPGTVYHLPDFQHIEAEYDVKVYHHLRVGDIITPYRTNLDGCGYVVACNENYMTAVSNAEAALKSINDGIVRK